MSSVSGRIVIRDATVLRLVSVSRWRHKSVLVEHSIVGEPPTRIRLAPDDLIRSTVNVDLNDARFHGET